MTQSPPQRFGLLIDADNISGADIDQVFDYLARQNYQVTLRRGYGGHEKLAGMKEMLRFRAVRAFVNQGKGTTDVALVVDAMDLLHNAGLPSVVGIASSDADFAPLALRLREAGIRVLCFANRLIAAPESLKMAYDEVVFIDEMTPDISATNPQANNLPADEHADTSLAKPTSQAAASFDDREVAPNHEAVRHELVEGLSFKVPNPAAAKPTVAKQPMAQAVSTVSDDPEIVRRILRAVPGWLPNTVQNLNQLGSPLRASGIATGSKPLHELFRKHPSYFKVQPTTGPAKQVKLLKVPK
jgi:hypothetical protein